MTDILQDFSSDVLARAVEQNGTECCLSWAAWPEIELGHNETMDWMLTGIPFPFFNNVFNAQIPEPMIRDIIEEALSRFRRRNVPMFWWTGPATRPRDLGEHLVASGCNHAFQAIAMAIDLDRMNEAAEVPSGLILEEVGDEAALRDWCAVMTPTYEFPDFAREPWFQMLAHLGLSADAPYRHFLARLDGNAVATSSIYFGAGVAGVSSVATLPDHRCKGIGTAVTLRALQAARASGFRIGVLFASAMGAGIYKKIGFREHGKGDCYVWLPDGQKAD